MDVIRDAGPDDTAPMLAIYEPLVRESIITFEERSPSPDEFARRIERSHCWLVSQRGAEVAGYAYASPFHPRSAYRWSAEVSVYVHPDHQRGGVGSALLQGLLDRLTAKGLVNVFAGIALPNDGSVRLFESIGFERIALQKEVGFKLGRWIDVGWWQKQLRDRAMSPAEPDL
ncbi:MAG TPA: GNAT family N-acetyltransferase [Actinomycetota bacterium]|nr:GNAT family N-acetyltransferase [Actinomycetota bacterium]